MKKKILLWGFDRLPLLCALHDIPTEMKKYDQHFVCPSDIEAPNNFWAITGKKKPLDQLGLTAIGWKYIWGRQYHQGFTKMNATAQLIALKITSSGSLKTSPLTLKRLSKLPKHWTVLQNMEQWFGNGNLACVWFYSSGNVMTSWCRMPSGGKRWQTLWQLRWVCTRVQQMAIGNWAKCRPKTPIWNGINRFVWWMDGRADLMRCLSKGVILLPTISPITGWPLTIVWLFPSV